MPARAGEPLDRLDEVEMLELANERDRVATLLAPEAVAREDVVLEHEGVRALDDRAVHLFDAIGRLDRPHDPAPAMKRLLRLREASAMLGQQEEVLDRGPRR